MSNHVHIIARSSSGKLSDTIRDFKKFTANKILEAINTIPESRRDWILHRFGWNAAHHKRNSNYQVWTHENHAIMIHSNEFFSQKMAYIHNNPVRAGWVARAEDYIYSSARQLFYDEEGKIKLAQWY